MVSLISLSWLKLQIKYLGLKRRGRYASNDTVKTVIARELRTSPVIWLSCNVDTYSLKYKLHVKRLG